MKPIFNRAPLTPNTVAPLSAGAVRAEGWLAKQLSLEAEALRQFPVPEDAVLSARLLDAKIALAWALGDNELRAACIDQVNELCATARPDGSFGPVNAPLTAAAAGLSAIRRLFTATGDRNLLPVMDHFFKYLYRRLENTPLKGDEVARGADLIELALWLYDLAGQKYLLDLCWRLRAQTIDWPDAFHAFRVKNPMNRTVSAHRMAEGLNEEAGEGSFLQGENRPYFATLDRISNGADIASGLKAPGVFNLIKSGFKEKDGFTFGWTRLTDSHGVANGLFTCDRKLNGRNPNQGTDLDAITELMNSLETLIGLGDLDSANRLCDILERVAFNALPAAFNADMTERQQLQQTNQVSCGRDIHTWYSDDGRSNLFGSDVAAGWDGWPRFTASLWYATDDGGLLAASYAPCSVRTALGGVPVKLTVSGGYPFGRDVRIEVTVKQPAEFPVYLRIPAWARQPMIYLPDGEIMQVHSGEAACIRRRWCSGDVVRLELPATPKLGSWYLHSGAVELGPLVMVCQPEEEWERDHTGLSTVRTSAPWNWALLRDEPMKPVYGEERTVPFHHVSDSVGVLVKAVPVRWNATRNAEGYVVGSAGTVPMGEKPCGAPCVLRLVPYGDTALRIAQFPVLQL